MYEPIAAKLGWDAKPGESALDTLLRGLVLTRLGTNGHAPTIQEAKKRFAQFLTNPDSLPVGMLTLRTESLKPLSVGFSS